MYFKIKNILKINYYYNIKHALDRQRSSHYTQTDQKKFKTWKIKFWMIQAFEKTLKKSETLVIN